MTRSTPCRAATVWWPFWYCLVTPVSLYMRSSPGHWSLDPAQRRRGTQPRGPPATERPGNEPARHGEHDGEGDRAERDGRGEVDGDGMTRGLRGAAETTAARAAPATAADVARTELPCAARRRRSACQADRRGQRWRELGDKRGAAESEPDADDAAGDAADDRLPHDLADHPPAAPAERLERAELPDPTRHG